MKSLLTLLLSIIILNSFAQKEDVNWTLYNNVLLNFNTAPPNVTTNLNNLNNFGVSCVSDKTGNLLFYGDCSKIYDKNNNLIYSSPANLHWRFRSIVIPEPNSIDTFYMFIHVEKIGFLFSQIIQIKIAIDNIGLAHVVNSIVLEESTDRLEFLQAMLHANNVDYWLLVGNSNSNKINSYKITGAGINLENTSFLQNNIGYHELNSLKSSPSMQQIFYSNGSNTISVLNFNRTTGTVSNFKDINHGFISSNFEFSPNGDKIYLSKLEHHTGENYNFIYQYSLNLINNEQAFLNSGIEIYKHKTKFRIGDLQIGYDNKIYFTEAGYTYLGVIENPNLSPPNCYSNRDGIFLNGKTAGLHFPHFLRYSSNFSYENNCKSISFIYNGFIPLSVLWNFGDSQTSIELEPEHTYTNAGTYTVILTVTYNDNTTKTISKQITIYDKPSQTTILHD